MKANTPYILIKIDLTKADTFLPPELKNYKKDLL